MKITKSFAGSTLKLKAGFDSSRLAPFEIQKIGELLIENHFLIEEHEIIDGREFLRRIAEVKEFSVDEHSIVDDLFDRATPLKHFKVKVTFESGEGSTIEQVITVNCCYEYDIMPNLQLMTSLKPIEAIVLGATSYKTIGLIEYDLLHESSSNNQSLA